jgi:transposase
MDRFVERCAGLDIGKKELKACVRVPGPRGGRRQEVRTFSTTTPGLLRLRDWLVACEVTLVGMESTGVYWKPVFYLLEDDLECWLLNPQHMRNVPGRKSDVSDAAWIAQLVEHGLVRASFVPPPEIRQLRSLTRYRASVVRDRAREAQRLHATLEDAGIKLGSVATDVLGVSGRKMLQGLIENAERNRPTDAAGLADLAYGRMRRKTGQLTDALTGRFSAHHARLLRLMLTRIDQADATLAALDEQIAAAMAPFRRQLELLDTIPGVGTRTAEVILAETGGDMSRFPTPEQLASWSGLCPGNHESAGRQVGHGRRHGDAWLAGALGDAAAAVARTKGTFLGERHRRLARRRGRNRALVATARAILEAAWHVLTRQKPYTDLGPGYHLTRQRHPERRAQHLLAELHALGYNATLTPAPSPT